MNRLTTTLALTVIAAPIAADTSVELDFAAGLLALQHDAPPASTARACSLMSVTLGVSLARRGRSVTSRTARTSCSVATGS